MSFYSATVNLIVMLTVLACTTQAVAAPVKDSSADKKKRSTAVVTGSSVGGYYHPTPNQESPHTEKKNVPENRDADKKPQNTAVKNRTIPAPKTSTIIPDKPKLDDKKSPTKRDAAKKKAQPQAQAIIEKDHKKKAELSFVWPIKGRVLKSFSPLRNKGIDIVGNKGQPIKATEAGQVVYVGQGLIGFGKFLIIKHNDAYLSAYANTSRLLVKEGQHVDQGQLIAEVGDVGIKRTSLHFEIRKNGKPVNPLIVLPEK